MNERMEHMAGLAEQVAGTAARVVNGYSECVPWRCRPQSGARESAALDLFRKQKDSV